MKRTLLLTIAVVAFALVGTALAQTHPTNGYIGLYGDAAGTICCITAGPGTTVLHVIAKLEGGSANGITGAEYRLELAQENGTAPSGWLFMWTPNPANTVSLGNPLDEAPQDPNNPAGNSIAFATCQPEPLGPQLSLGTLTAVNLGSGTPFLSRTKEKAPHSSPTNGDCPLYVLCDPPVFTTICQTVQTQNNMGAEGIAFVSTVNVACTPPSPCGPVAVEERTWSTMKELYRQ